MRAIILSFLAGALTVSLLYCAGLLVKIRWKKIYLICIGTVFGYGIVMHVYKGHWGWAVSGLVVLAVFHIWIWTISKEQLNG